MKNTRVHTNPLWLSFQFEYRGMNHSESDRGRYVAIC